MSHFGHVSEYQGHFHWGQFDFKPLTIELTGRWGTDLTSFFNAVCRKARTLHGLNATRYGYFVSYWRSRISVSFTRSLAEQAVHTKLQILEKCAFLSREVASNAECHYEGFTRYKFALVFEIELQRCIAR